LNVQEFHDNWHCGHAVIKEIVPLSGDGDSVVIHFTWRTLYIDFALIYII